MPLPSLWFHREASLAEPGDPVVSRALSWEELEAWQRSSRAHWDQQGLLCPLVTQDNPRTVPSKASVSLHLPISYGFLSWSALILNLKGGKF